MSGTKKLTEVVACNLINTRHRSVKLYFLLICSKRNIILVVANFTPKVDTWRIVEKFATDKFPGCNICTIEIIASSWEREDDTGRIGSCHPSYTHPHTNPPTHIPMCTHTHTHTHVHPYPYTYAHTLTHVHACDNALVLSFKPSSILSCSNTTLSQKHFYCLLQITFYLTHAHNISIMHTHTHTSLT